MARRLVRRPFFSVVVVARDAEPHLVRTLESVLNQGFDDLQLVIADCASRDRTASICRRAAERDIRVDVLEFDDDDRAAAFDGALEKARGRYVLVLGQSDWLAPNALGRLHALIEQHDLQLAIMALSLDEDAANGERSSHRLSFDVAPTSSADEFRDAASPFLADGIFAVLKGKVLDADRIEELGLRMQLCGSDVAYLATYLEEVARVGVADEAVYHMAKGEPARPFTMAAYEQCEHTHACLLELLVAWRREHDARLVTAVHRLHLRELISCIEGVCGQHGISSIERNARVRDMIEAPSTRATITVLGTTSREFGFMYGPIVRKNVMACCLSARLALLARISHLPFASTGCTSLSCA